MPHRFIVAVLACAALLVLPAVAAAAPAPSGPPIPASLTLPTKVVSGTATTGTVCLDQVATEPTQVLLFSDNTFLAQVPESVTIAAGEQCASFPVTTTSYPKTVSVIISAYANGVFADQVLYLIPQEGVDLIDITKADVNRTFTKLTVVATSDEPGAILTAYANGVELGVLEQKGSRYVGRFTLDGTPINQVEVRSNLGGCAQRAVPFGNSSTLC